MIRTDRKQFAFASAAAAFRGGARDAFGVRAAVLAAGFVGYGALAYEQGYSIWLTMFATAAVWALPAQLILLELYSLGAAAVAIIAAAALSSARFLPMTVSLMPVLHERRYGRTIVYVVAQLISMTSWTWAMLRCPELPQEQRFPYFSGFALTCMLVSVACCPIGFYLSGAFPPWMRLGFVFLAPVYFFVILVGDIRTWLSAVALACGAIAGPLLYVVDPKWSVLASGLVGGTIAYVIQRTLRRMHA